MTRTCFAVDRWLSLQFRAYGLTVCRYSKWFFIVPLVIAAVLSCGIYRIPELEIIDPEEVYVPTDGLSIYERETIQEHWPTDPNNFVPGRSFDLKRTMQCIVRSKTGGNLLTPQLMADVKAFNDYLLDEIGVFENGSMPLYIDDDVSTMLYTYRRLCPTWDGECSFVNNHVEILDVLVRNRHDPKYGDRFTYPRIDALGGSSVPLYIGNGVGDITLKEDGSQLAEVRAIHLVYYLRFENETVRLLSGKWEQAVSQFMEGLSADPNSTLDIAYHHSTSTQEGLKENETVLLPKFTIAILILFIFATLSTLKLHATKAAPYFTVDWIGSKTGLAVFGLITAGIGCSSSLGLLLYCGVTYVTINAVMPFVILSIGIDDMFIMIAAWRRTDPSLPVEERIGDALADCAVSITITSVTSFLSFAVGSISTINGIKYFCAYTSLGVALNYLYQITFFVSCMYFAGLVEARGRNGVIWFWKNGSFDFNWKSEPRAQPATPAQNPHHLVHDDDVLVLFFRKVYGPALLKWPVKAMTCILLVVYLATAFFGCSQLREGLKPQNTVPKNHHVAKFYDYMERFMWPLGQQLEIVVNNAPNLTIPGERQKLEQMVTDFEDTQYTMTAVATDFWYREFIKFLRDSDVDVFDTETVWTDYLNVWSTLNFILKIFSQDLAWRTTDNDVQVLDAFRFRIGLKDFSTTYNQKHTAKLIRGIASNYPEYNITTYAQYWPFTDQYLVILRTTLQNIAIAMACMVVTTLVLIPEPICVAWIVAAVASIDIGVIGYMTLWAVNLDAISMITIIMSIGLSVDYTAHIAYGYVLAEGTPNERAIQALESLGLPVLQGALSTILGMLTLAFIQSYILQTFFKTMFLAIVLGILHACLFLPTLLTLSTELTTAIQNHRKRAAVSPVSEMSNTAQTAVAEAGPVTNGF